MKTILVVEDERPIAQLLAMVLEDEGYQVILAANGREALACLPDTRPDLILSDLMMPYMDGWQLCQALHEHPYHRHTPLVLMSAARDFVAQERCHYVAFLAKPLELNHLLDLVASLLL